MLLGLNEGPSQCKLSLLHDVNTSDWLILAIHNYVALVLYFHQVRDKLEHDRTVVQSYQTWDSVKEMRHLQLVTGFDRPK